MTHLNLLKLKNRFRNVYHLATVVDSLRQVYLDRNIRQLVGSSSTVIFQVMCDALFTLVSH